MSDGAASRGISPSRVAAGTHGIGGASRDRVAGHLVADPDRLREPRANTTGAVEDAR